MPTSTRQHTLTIRGRRLRYRVSGRGPVLMVQTPGWGIGCGMYVSAMAPLDGSFTVIHHDTQGSGESDAPSDPKEMNVGSFVEDLDALRQHLGVERFALMGHSHGGFIAMNYVLKYPQHVSHLIAVDAQLGVAEPGDDVRRTLPLLAQDPRLAEAARIFSSPWKLITDADLSEMLYQVMPLYFFDPASAQCEAARQYVRSMRMSAAAMKATAESNGRFLLREKLGAICARTLVLVGRHDFLCSPVQAQLIHEGIVGSQHVIFEKSGHMPWAEEPDIFFPTVLGFLKG